MIRSFLHRGLQRFFETGSKAGIQPHHAIRLQLQLTALNVAKTAGDMNAPGWKLNPLKGESKGRWAITVNGNWRLTFMFEGADVVLLDYVDSH